LQEKVDHQDYECERDQKGDDDFLHAFRNGARGVQGHDEIQVFREALLQLGHELIHAGGGIDGVRARQLVDGNDGAGLSVITSGNGV